MEHRYAEVNGVRLHYVAEGDGPLILFVHGFPEFWYEWRNQLPEFGRDHLAVAPDTRGYNLSSKPEAVDQYRVKHLVEDLRQLAHHLRPGEKFVLVAHDWGGATAWAYAMQHPGTLRGLVIINAPHPGIFSRELRQNPGQQKASEYMLMFRTPEAESVLSANGFEMLRKMVLGWGLKQGILSEADQDKYLEAWAQPGALTGGLNYYRAAEAGPARPGETLPAFEIPPEKLMVHVPTLVIWGERDKALLTGNLDGLEQFVPDLTVRRIPDGSHWVVNEQPARVNQLIREFIQRLG
ncbi:MAG: alpha/beta hydrolase [Bryobacteraceae bacterium]|nr:alpha/beta hydrolase [Bryobacteraceae bacterium]